MPEGELAFETWLLHKCSELIGMRQLSAHTLRSDAERSMLFLRDLHSILNQLKEQRHASESGPTERETSVKMLYERVHRSFQRTVEEIRIIHGDMEMINQFCGGGLIVHREQTPERTPEMRAPGLSHQTAFPLGSPGYHGAPATLVQQDPHQQPTPEEVHQQKPQKLAHHEGHKSQQACTGAAMKHGSKGVAQHGPLVVPSLPLDLLPQEHPPQPWAWPSGPVSPSSGSSVSSDFDTSVPQPMSVNVAGTPGVASLASLPQTPPQPQAPHVMGTAVIQTLHEGIGHHPGAHGGHWRGSAGNAEEDARRQASAPLPRPQATSLGCSVSTMPMPAGASANVFLGPHGERSVQGDAQLRKSHSTASLRTLGLRPGNAGAHVVGASATIAPGQSSPVLGNRGDGMFPVRGSLSGSLTVAGAAGAGRGAMSPLLPPKRPAQTTVASCSTRASGSHRPGVRATTPAQRPNGSTPSVSYSPMVLGRGLSSTAQPWRYEKTQLKVSPSAGATAPKRNASPDRGATTGAASPMRQPRRTGHQGASLPPTQALGTSSVAWKCG